MDDKAMDVAAKRMHEAYLLCRDVFDPHNTFVNNEAHVKAVSHEEMLFCVTVGDFFLQRRQLEIIAREGQKNGENEEPKRPLTTILEPHIISKWTERSVRK